MLEEWRRENKKKKEKGKNKRKSENKEKSQKKKIEKLRVSVRERERERIEEVSFSLPFTSFRRLKLDRPGVKVVLYDESST